MSEKPSALEMRLGGSFLKTVDEWRRKQKDRPSRAEAIRRLVERGLANQSPARQLSKGAKRKAAKMAGQEIDRIGDQTATRAERARRKRRLIKGPREFRNIRYKTKAETNSQ
jgi:Arc/MetJ-type ribon-helix-helix transcriptional regulator